MVERAVYGQWLTAQMSDFILPCEASIPGINRCRLEVSHFSDCTTPSHTCLARSAAGCRAVVCCSTRRKVPKGVVTGDTLESTGHRLLTERGKLNAAPLSCARCPSETKSCVPVDYPGIFWLPAKLSVGVRRITSLHDHCSLPQDAVTNV